MSASGIPVAATGRRLRLPRWAAGGIRRTGGGVPPTGEGARPPRARRTPSDLRGTWHAATTRARALAGRVPLTVSPLGALAVAGAVAALVVGAHRGWVELLALGSVLLTAAVAALAWTLGRSRYDAAIHLDSVRVKIGEQALGRVLVRNQHRRSLLPARIEMPVGAAVAHVDLPGLGRGEEHEEFFAIPARRRSVVTLGPLRSVRGDPLGLMSRQQDWTQAVDLYIHPRILPLGAAHSGFLRDVEGVTTANLSSSDVSFHALRDYVPGDDRRAIHWRTTARLGRLMVRQFEETRRSHLLLVLSLRARDYRDPQDFETAVSAVGSLAYEALLADRRVSVVTHTGEVTFGSGPLLLDRLSAVEVADRYDDLRALAGRASALVPGASVVALVCGGGVSPTDLHGAQAALPLDVVALAVRCDRDSPSARRRIGRLEVLDVPTLDDLPRAVRSVA